MHIEILCVGRLKKGPFADLFDDYLKRMDWSIKVTELESKHTQPNQIHLDECRQIEERLTSQSVIIAMDERGKTLSSRALAGKIEHFQTQGHSQLQFVIGGADGLNDAIRKRANFLLSFGEQTWPHMLARVMLLEQIYRSQQILKNHPYHRD